MLKRGDVVEIHGKFLVKEINKLSHIVTVENIKTAEVSKLPQSFFESYFKQYGLAVTIIGGDDESTD